MCTWVAVTSVTSPRHQNIRVSCVCVCVCVNVDAWSWFVIDCVLGQQRHLQIERLPVPFLRVPETKMKGNINGKKKPFESFVSR